MCKQGYFHWQKPRVSGGGVEVGMEVVEEEVEEEGGTQ